MQILRKGTAPNLHFKCPFCSTEFVAGIAECDLIDTERLRFYNTEKEVVEDITDYMFEKACPICGMDVRSKLVHGVN